MHQVVMPVRVMKMLGAQYIFLSNAAGAVNPDFKKGELMLVDDHINMQSANPLRGMNLDELGPRFPDMSQPYSQKLNSKILELAASKGIKVNTGVYASVPGPNLETRAEYRMLRMLGADAVGMSTVPEVIACNHMGVPCCCISVLTDECNPDNLKPVDISEIIAVAKKSEGAMTELYIDLIKSL
jgi:purine-nucleoside phosphorylase